jgi:hypothetical protein
VPPRGLPGNANLEQLKNGAKSFQRAVRAGDAGAAEVVREFHPRLGHAQPGSAELATFKRADAQLVVARSFGFASWPKLKAYVELTPRYSRSPHAQPIGEPIHDQEGLVDEFLRLACLTYGGDDPARWAKARELLASHPELATATIHTIAAIGEVAGARELLERDPGAAARQGGPHDWEPLLYLTYSRLGPTGPGRDALATAQVLLDHGADPEARGTRNHAYELRTPREEAMLRGHRECAELLRAAGATPGATPLYVFLEAATDGDRDRVRRLLADDRPSPARRSRCTRTSSCARRNVTAWMGWRS